MATEASRRPKIVVGVDGSAASSNALRWALHQAQLEGSEVRAVIAWDFPAASAWMAVPGPDLREAAQSVLAGVVAREGGTAPQVPLSQQVEYGNAAQVLLHESATADLLVVGSRGLGGFAGVLIGSVGRYCVEHAKCPVVVVRDKDT